jgi:hypothetical protein
LFSIDHQCYRFNHPTYTLPEHEQYAVVPEVESGMIPNIKKHQPAIVALIFIPALLSHFS